MSSEAPPSTPPPPTHAAAVAAIFGGGDYPLPEHVAATPGNVLGNELYAALCVSRNAAEAAERTAAVLDLYAQWQAAVRRGDAAGAAALASIAPDRGDRGDLGDRGDGEGDGGDGEVAPPFVPLAGDPGVSADGAERLDVLARDSNGTMGFIRAGAKGYEEALRLVLDFFEGGGRTARGPGSRRPKKKKEKEQQTGDGGEDGKDEAEDEDQEGNEEEEEEEEDHGHSSGPIRVVDVSNARLNTLAHVCQINGKTAYPGLSLAVEFGCNLDIKNKDGKTVRSLLNAAQQEVVDAALEKRGGRRIKAARPG